MAVRDPRLARRNPASAGLLSDQLPDHGARDHLPLGRADGDDGDRVRRRRPVPRRLRPPGRPGARRAADVEVAGDRNRPARRDRRHGADALRFGMLAISSTQDVRYSPERIQQGRDLANKLWNASRLVLLNAGDAEPEPRPDAARGPLDPVPAASGRSRTCGERIDEYDFSHAVLGFYSFFWSELCDWYLEIVKPRLYDGDEDAAANLLHVLEQVLALMHPVMPFVTEEIWSYLPDREGMLIASEFPSADAVAGRRRGRASPSRPGSGPFARSAAGAISSVSRPARCSMRACDAASRVSSWPARPADARRRRRRGRWRRSARSRSSPRTRSTPSRPRPGSRASAAAARARSSALERKLGNEGFVAKAPAGGGRGRAREARRLPRGARPAGVARWPGPPNRARPTSAR